MTLSRQRPRLILLQAAEVGWESPDPMYAGYDPSDCELWAYERDVVQIADAIAATS